MSQKSQILAALKRGRSLTPLDALVDFNCMSLAQRIMELKNEGHNITSELIRTPSGKHIAIYKLKKKRNIPKYKLKRKRK